jgi:tetratricopeptide (TPR) repeat protein
MLEQQPWTAADVDEVARKLRLELERSRSVFEIAAKVEQGTDEVRLRCKVLLGVADGLVNQPDLLEQLVKEGTKQWPAFGFAVAKHLHAAGQTELAATFIDRNSEEIGPDPDHTVLQRAISTIVEVGMIEKARPLLGLFVEKYGRDKSVLSQFLSVAATLQREGYLTDAEQLWKCLLAFHPEDAALRKKYLKFQVAATKSDSPDAIPAIGSAGQLNVAERVADPHFEEAKRIAKTRERGAAVDLCAQSLAGNADDQACNQWMSIAQIVAVNYAGRQAAVEIWRIILTHAPRFASAFLSFCSRNRLRYGHDPDLDRLLEWARNAKWELPQSGNNKGRFIELKRGGIDKEALSQVVVIDGQRGQAQQWITEAGMYVSAGRYDDAFRIWMALLSKQPGIGPSVTRGIIRMAELVPDDQYLAMLKIGDRAKECPPLALIFRSVAANLESRNLERSFALLRELNTLTGTAGDRYTLANRLVHFGQYDEAVQLWLPLEARYANACARSASDLARAQQHAQAQVLFLEVSRVCPAASIRHGYEYFQNPDMGDLALACIAPLVPAESDQNLPEHMRLALRLFVRHCRDQRRVVSLLEALVRNSAITPEEAGALSGVNYTRVHRDADIEDYLRREMPDLRRGKFFAAVESGEVPLMPGKRTNTTARDVIFRPGKMTNGPRRKPL